MHGVMRTNKIAIKQLDPPARALQSHIVSARSQGKSSFRADGRHTITKRPNSRASAARARLRPPQSQYSEPRIGQWSATEELPPRQESTAVDREQAEWTIYYRCKRYSSNAFRLGGQGSVCESTRRWRMVIVPGLSFRWLACLLDRLSHGLRVCLAVMSDESARLGRGTRAT